MHPVGLADPAVVENLEDRQGELEQGDQAEQEQKDRLHLAEYQEEPQRLHPRVCPNRPNRPQRQDQRMHCPHWPVSFYPSFCSSASGSR